jgi:hypothetical protein
VSNDPQTPDEWQEVADAADFLLLLDAARQYGLIAGGPVANVDRCVALLERAAARGVFPSPPERRCPWIGRWLRHERTTLGISQQQLAERAGVTQAWLSLVERAKANCNHATWERLNTALEQIRKEQGKESC